jgi:glycosyltransferase involved in cell wall biosynthesis
MAKVDVIIPTYNGMPYLQQAVQSVLAQSFKDLRLYVIDDDSPDRKPTDKYLASVKDSRLTYIKRPHQGRSQTRNHGIKISKSPYIAFLDADDVWRPDKLAKQVEALEANESLGMVYGLCKLVDQGSHETGELTYNKSGNLFRYLLTGNNISGSASMVLIRRKVLEEVGGFRKDFSMAEDWELWLRIAKKYRIHCVHDFLADIRTDAITVHKKFLEKAKGLDYAFPLIVKEFNLSFFERAKLAKACYSQACLLYLDGGDRQAARHAMFKLFGYNPLAIFTSGKRMYFAYARLLIGSSWIRGLRRRLSSNYRSREAAKHD